MNIGKGREEVGAIGEGVAVAPDPAVKGSSGGVLDRGNYSFFIRTEAA